MIISTETRTIRCDETIINYQLEQKNVKNLNLRIRYDGKVFVSASPDVPPEQIDSFVERKQKFIVKSLKHFEELCHYKSEPKKYVSGEAFSILGHGLRLVVSKSPQNRISADGIYIRLYAKEPDNFEMKKKMVTRYFDRQCRKIFSEILSEIYPAFEKYGVMVPRLQIRDMETRWGSCLAKKGIITLNKRLLEVPKNCIEYVIVHELCHFIQPNHSRHFYMLLTMFMPDWKERKMILDKYADYWL